MAGEDTNPEGFKTCPLCGEHWATLEDFVQDRLLALEGYTAAFDDPGRGLVFVTHRPRRCGTTMTIPAARLLPLHRGPVHPELRKGGSDCRRLCLDRRRLEECDAPCAMAWVRSVMQCLRAHEVPEEA
ncbi:hypothetical protein LLH23_20585 [bacterium]|nr:hypothetical protein [bacterium]